MINRERLAETFVRLCETDSPSRHEAAVARLLREMLAELEPQEILEDDSAALTGSDCGNLLVRFSGRGKSSGLFFNCHMDTVEPGTGVRVRRQDDIFFSAGDTILGSDDKAGIAALLEALRVVREECLESLPVELVFTTCEEIGLLGVKALDPKLVHAAMGYALDTSGSGRVITAAPAANRLQITVSGVAAHAGLHPEWGVSAIALAAEAISRVPLGRIDGESTVNLGTIRGGVASNIVPERVTIEGEVRSHDQEKLQQLTAGVEQAFRETIANWRDPSGEARGVPILDFCVRQDFPAMDLAPGAPVLRRIALAAREVGMDVQFEKAGGGSDANIFNGYGLPTAIVATGMTHVHSTDEQVSLDDMVTLSRLLVALMTSPEV